jgi:Ribosomal protein S8
MMRTNDPIADFLTRIRNASNAQHKYVDIPWSHEKQSLAEVLQNNGLVESFAVKLQGTWGMMRVYLKYTSTRQPVLRGLKRISKPGLRRYAKATELRPYFRKMAVPVISTSQGILDGRDAEKRRLGGEVLCVVW